VETDQLLKDHQLLQVLTYRLIGIFLTGSDVHTVAVRHGNRNISMQTKVQIGKGTGVRWLPTAADPE